MKKLFVICLIFLMLFSLCACSNQSAVDITEQPSSSLDPAAGAPASQLPQQLTTNITLDAELPQNTGKVDILTVGFAPIDMEAAKQLFWRVKRSQTMFKAALRRYIPQATEATCQPRAAFLASIPIFPSISIMCLSGQKMTPPTMQTLF